MATANVTARAISRASAIKEVIMDFANIPRVLGIETDFDFEKLDSILDQGIARNRLIRAVVFHFYRSNRIEAEVFFRINWLTMDAEARVHGANVDMPKARNSSQSLSQRLYHLYELVTEVARTQRFQKMSWLIYWRDEDSEIRNKVNTVKAQFGIVTVAAGQHTLIEEFRRVAEGEGAVTRGVEPSKIRGFEAGFTCRK